MSWRYTLRDDLRMPPCPYPHCGSRLSVVRLRANVFVCMDHLPRVAFEAEWVADQTIAPAGTPAIGRTGVAS